MLAQKIRVTRVIAETQGFLFCFIVEVITKPKDFWQKIVHVERKGTYYMDNGVKKRYMFSVSTRL